MLLWVQRLDLDRAGDQLLNLSEGSHAVHLLLCLHQYQAQADVGVLVDVPRLELLFEEEDVRGIEPCPLNADILATLLHDKRALEVLCSVCAVDELKCCLIYCSDLGVLRERCLGLILLR